MPKGPTRLEGPFGMELKVEAIVDANPQKIRRGSTLYKMVKTIYC
jgi:hypothetical protein